MCKSCRKDGWSRRKRRRESLCVFITVRNEEKLLKKEEKEEVLVYAYQTVILFVAFLMAITALPLTISEITTTTQRAIAMSQHWRVDKEISFYFFSLSLYSFLAHIPILVLLHAALLLNYFTIYTQLSIGTMPRCACMNISICYIVIKIHICERCWRSQMRTIEKCNHMHFYVNIHKYKKIYKNGHYIPLLFLYIFFTQTIIWDYIKVSNSNTPGTVISI